MIKHTLMWKLKPLAEGRSKAENIQVATRALHALKEEIDAIRRIEVGHNFAEVDNAYDMAITVEFDTREDFNRFLDHPAHKQLGVDVRRYRETGIVVDYEL
jgi:hypothetical protein